MRSVDESVVAVAMLRLEADGTCQEQIEKVLERNTRRSWERNERTSAIWEDMSRGITDGFIIFRPPLWSISGVTVVDVENAEGSILRNIFSFVFWLSSDI